MLDKFLVLLERFVVAHELIAANSAKQVTTVIGQVAEIETPAKELAVEGEDIIDAKPAKEDDLSDDEEPEEKPKRKPRQAKPKEEPKKVDIEALRAEIKTIAKAIAAGESDECADKFDELLDNYKVRTVPKLLDEDVEAFYEEAKKLVAKYYEIED